MAIQINGNGTITGISVGGLPDGIVDTDMLAANSVATAKIADSAVTSAKTTGVGGEIGKVEHYTNDYNYTFSSQTLTDLLSASGTTWEVSIVPSKASSKIWVNQCLFITSLNTSTNEHRYNMELFAKVNSGSYSKIVDYDYMGTYNYIQAGTVMDAVPVHLSHLHTPSYSVGDTITFKWMGQLITNSANLGFSNGDKTSAVTLLEVLT